VIETLAVIVNPVGYAIAAAAGEITDLGPMCVRRLKAAKSTQATLELASP
jgi:hypothetical protein